MKTNTTYPTKHPYWIDEDDGRSSQIKSTGISFRYAFVIVLTIHLAGIALVFVCTSLRAKKAVPVAQASSPNPAGPKSDALSRNEWPEVAKETKLKASTPTPANHQIASQTRSCATEHKPAPALAKTCERLIDATAKSPVIQASRTQNSNPSAGNDTARKNAFLATRSASTRPVRQESVPSSAAEVKPPAVADHLSQSAPDSGLAPKASFATSHADVQTPTHQTAPAEQPAEYILAAGDNLYMVSRRLQVSYSDLMRANGLTDPRQLRVGQKLKVPSNHMASL